MIKMKLNLKVSKLKTEPLTKQGVKKLRVKRKGNLGISSPSDKIYLYFLTEGINSKEGQKAKIVDLTLATQLPSKTPNEEAKIRCDDHAPKMEAKTSPKGKISRKPTLSMVKDGSNKMKATLALLETQLKYPNNYTGIELSISGRLRGAQRARGIRLNWGRVSTQTFNQAKFFYKKQIPTKWGTWGSSIKIAR